MALWCCGRTSSAASVAQPDSARAVGIVGFQRLKTVVTPALNRGHAGTGPPRRKPAPRLAFAQAAPISPNAEARSVKVTAPEKPQSIERPFLRSVAGAAVLAGAVCAPAPGAHAQTPPASMHARPADLAWPRRCALSAADRAAVACDRGKASGGRLRRADWPDGRRYLVSASSGDRERRQRAVPYGAAKPIPLSRGVRRCRLCNRRALLLGGKARRCADRSIAAARGHHPTCVQEQRCRGRACAHPRAVASGIRAQRVLQADFRRAFHRPPSADRAGSGAGTRTHGGGCSRSIGGVFVRDTRFLLAGYPIPEIAINFTDREIEVSGPHVNRGYLDRRDDAATKVARDGQLWHRTGDCGRLDAKGRLWLLGRRAAAAENLYPFAIETAALSWPRVRQAALVAETDGARLAIAGSRLDEADLRERARELGVGNLIVLQELPTDRRHNSKIDYARLRARIGRATKKAGAPPGQSP